MSTSAAELIHLIRSHPLRIFTTADILTLSGMKPAATTQALRRLAAHHLVTRIKRGLWANRLVESLNPYEIVPYLMAPWPAYVSLYSALAEYGVVEELPQVVYAVSSNRPALYQTAFGSFHIHHLPDHLMWGYEIRKTLPARYPIAEAEKAFLDLLYLALIPRSRLKFPYNRQKNWNLDRDKLKKYALRFKFQPMIHYLNRHGLCR